MRRYISIAGVVSFAALYLFSCKPAEHFGEYRDVNLISEKGFNSGVWVPDPEEAYYMNFEEVTAAEAGTTEGLPSGASIYRLEIPNLLPNGDFEESAVGTGLPDKWSTSGTPDVEIIDPTTATLGNSEYAINNNTLYFDIVAKRTRLDFQLNHSQNGLADGFVTGGTYLIRFDIKATEYTVFGYNNGTEDFPEKAWTFPNSETLDTRTFPSALIDPMITAESDDSLYFSIGVFDEDIQQSQLAYIDNIRIIRTDIDQFLRYPLPIEEEDGSRPPLVDGYYTFSLYVKEDPSHTKANATASNRFPAVGVTLQLSLKKGGELQEITMPVVYRPDDEEADWSQWSRISITTNKAFGVTRFDSDEEVRLELMISPTDTTMAGNYKDAGSVLIASPSLEYLPDGP